MGDAKRKSQANIGAEKSHSVKRQRVSRACDQCRAAREKCDGIQPICFSCATSNRNCSYTANPKKRGIQPGYIRTLELALASLLINVDGCEASLRTTLQDEKGQALLSGSDADSSNKLHRKWRKSPICKAIDGLLSGTGLESALADASPEDDAEDDDEEERPNTSTAEASLLTPDSHSNNFPRPYPENNIGGPGNFAGLSKHASRPSMAASTQPNRGTQTQVLLKLPENTWRLLDVYFAYTHSWLPIVEKEYILKISYSYPKEGLKIGSDSSGSGDQAELWSILAIAAFQDAASGRSEARSEAGTSQISPTKIYDVARSLIPNESGTLELGHICALLLLSLIKVGSQKFSTAWVLLGYAIRGLVLLDQSGLLGESQANFMDVNQQSIRIKPVALACFLLDTIYSAHLGTLPYLRKEQVEAIGLLKEEGLDEWQPWTGCTGFNGSIGGSARARSPMLSISIFNQLLRLCCVLNRGFQQCQDQVFDHGTEVNTWYAGLPFNLQSATLQDEDSTPQRLNLSLAYAVAKALSKPSSTDHIGDAHTALERYARVLGGVAMPPLFSLYISILHRNSPANLDSYFSYLEHQLPETWKSLIDTSPSLRVNTSPKHIRRESASMPQSQDQLMYLSNQPLETTPLNGTLEVPFNSYSLIQNIDAPHHDSLYDGTYLEPYNASGTMDLDAIFDDLASLDGVERVDSQFMQNLGFLTSDFGQLDPLLDVYGDPAAQSLVYNPG